MSEKFRKVSPAEIPGELAKQDVVGLVVVNTTVITTEDDKILLLGSQNRKGVKLPSLDTRVHSREYLERPFVISSHLIEFLFQDPNGLNVPDDYDYLGLLKAKPPKRRFVLPMIVDLDCSSDDPRLEPSQEWLRHEHEQPDFLWTSLDDLEGMIAKQEVYDDSVTRSISATTAEMLEHYVEHDTYLEELALTGGN